MTEFEKIYQNYNPRQAALDEARALLTAAAKAAMADGALPEAELPAFIVEIPADTKNGDIASNIAMAGARSWRKAPKMIADALLAHLPSIENSVFAKVEVAGPGFINLFLAPSFWASVVLGACSNKEYGRTDHGKGAKYNVEFVSANPTGPMHMGNARGGALGDCLSAVLDWSGYDVTREFYINDAGNQIQKFGKSLAVRYLQKYCGEEAYPLPAECYQGGDIKVLAGEFAELNGDKYVAACKGMDFIDPGNWASNFAAGADFGYSLLWVITLSTIMLIVLQHNVAHLGIVTGLCLSEAATKYTPKWVSRPILGTAVLASISTSLAEILGGAIALEMLFDIPIIWGSLLTAFFVTIMLFTNSYKRIERSIIAFVSVIGLSFLYELFLVDIDWPLAARSWVTPSIPEGSLLVIMSVLGAVVMPHNLFLHSEVVQSREYNKKDDASIRKLLKYEFYDTLFSMGVGWAINSAMILLAAATFFAHHIGVEELQQAKSLLEPLLGNQAATIFALALLMAGISSTVTSGMAAGSIFAGMFGESYHVKDVHSRVGILLSLGIALVVILFIENPFQGLIISQMILSIQLPFTIFLQVGLTSSKRVMGQYANSRWSSFVLYTMAVIVSVLNLALLFSESF